MLALDEKKLDQLCKLAKLKIDDNEKEQFLSRINGVFDWIEQLSQIDVSNIDINDLSQEDTTYEREDVPVMNNTREEILSNTNNKNFDMFCVPKVVE
ncbi:MAG: Asp-tRNA(Asn)/Glu-tRNA(Gln) amidotransferase subunit GatC [Alphaproteobacteria bacterium]|nr:Asp-tRNA(Asn)/Glu-tRNA(Gln) amidotransferase subunit GatC [Alphaproteobacteria bacterium]